MTGRDSPINLTNDIGVFVHLPIGIRVLIGGTSGVLDERIAIVPISCIVFIGEIINRE